ncbi:MAG: ABC transporter ATP-binding protein, partial [Oscillospiraceae bacterium]|nr:ABC transporter ATP-binding protein [Oscillospiraceae bacterium]
MAAFDEKEYTKAFDWSIWKRLLPIVARFKRYFAGMVGFAAISDLVDAALPLFQMYAIGYFIQAGTLDGIVPFTVFYGAVILFQGVLVVVSTRNTMHIEMYMGRDLRKELFEHLQTLSLSFYNVTPVGYLLTRITNDTSRIAGNLSWGLLDLVDVTFYVGSSFVIMFLLNWQLALVVILVVPFVVVLTGYFQPRILQWNREVRKINSKITGAFNEGITGAKTSKTLVIEDQSIRGFRELTGNMNRSAVRAARLNAVYIPITLFFSSLTVA